jgi:hypothetical protein
VIRVEMQRLERLKRRDEKPDLTAAPGGCAGTVAGAMKRNEAGYDPEPLPVQADQPHKQDGRAAPETT